MDPPLHPGTHAPLTPQDLAPLFPMELIEQEFSPRPTIDIPGEVMDIYRLFTFDPIAARASAAGNATLERVLDNIMNGIGDKVNVPLSKLFPDTNTLSSVASMDSVQ
jgi:predicted alternative tryptophan synthase beta-subunit